MGAEDVAEAVGGGWSRDRKLLDTLLSSLPSSLCVTDCYPLYGADKDGWSPVV